MKPNPRNILKLSDKRYDAKEPRKNRRLDVVYSLFKRRDPLPAQTEMAFFTDTSICSCLLYTSPSPRDKRQSRMPSSA